MHFATIFFLTALFFINSSEAKFCSLRNVPRKVTINPPTMFNPQPFGYSHVVVDTKNAVAYIAGQVAFNKTGAVIGKTLAEQLTETERNIKLALKAVDADVNDIVKTNIFIANYNPATDFDAFKDIGMRLGRAPNTVFSVPALALDSILVEIETTAVVPMSFIRKLACK